MNIADLTSEEIDIFGPARRCHDHGDSENPGPENCRSASSRRKGLVHDSPREADMPHGNYQRLFVHIREQEKAFSDTTTILTATAPPLEYLQKKPWIIANFNAAVEDERLLGVNS